MEALLEKPDFTNTESITGEPDFAKKQDLHSFGEGHVFDKLNIVNLYTEFTNILKIEIEIEGATREINFKKLFKTFSTIINSIQKEVMKSGMPRKWTFLN